MARRFAILLLLLQTLALAGCGGDDTAPPPGGADAQAPAATVRDADAAETLDPAVPVDSLQIPYGETGEDLLYGYFVYPSGMVAPLPAVIVVHEWFGLNDSVRNAAARIAGQGYMVLAIDLFRGETAETSADASVLARRLLEEPGFAEMNLRAAHTFLTDGAGAPSVATLGWSMGAYWALEASRFMPDDIEAVVVYYGQPDSDPGSVGSIAAPVLALYGGADRSIPTDSVRALQEQAKALEKPLQAIIYAGAQHGFANPDDARYDATAAARAWQEVTTFLGQHLAR